MTASMITQSLGVIKKGSNPQSAESGRLRPFLLFFEAETAKIIFGSLINLWGEDKRCGHCWNGHKGKHPVNNVDNSTNGGDGSKKDGENIEIVIIVLSFCANQKTKTFGPIVGIGEHGGYAENNHTKNEYIDTNVGNSGAKSVCCECYSLCIAG